MRAFDTIMSFVLIAAVLGVFDLVTSYFGWKTRWGSVPLPVTQFAVAIVALGVFLDPRPFPLTSKIFVILLVALTLGLAHKTGN